MGGLSTGSWGETCVYIYAATHLNLSETLQGERAGQTATERVLFRSHIPRESLRGRTRECKWASYNNAKSFFFGLLYNIANYSAIAIYSNVAQWS